MKMKLVEQLRELFPNGHPKFTDMTIDELKLHSDKNYDYAFGGDPLGNFNRVALILSQYPNLDICKPEIVALVYMLKQLDAVLWMMAKGHKGQVEGIDKRLEDVHVYAKIARIILGENK